MVVVESPQRRGRAAVLGRAYRVPLRWPRADCLRRSSARHRERLRPRVRTIRVRKDARDLNRGQGLEGDLWRPPPIARVKPSPGTSPARSSARVRRPIRRGFHEITKDAVHLAIATLARSTKDGPRRGVASSTCWWLQVESRPRKTVKKGLCGPSRRLAAVMSSASVRSGLQQGRILTSRRSSRRRITLTRVLSLDGKKPHIPTRQPRRRSSRVRRRSLLHAPPMSSDGAPQRTRRRRYDQHAAIRKSRRSLASPQADDATAQDLYEACHWAEERRFITYMRTDRRHLETAATQARAT